MGACRVAEHHFLDRMTTETYDRHRVAALDAVLRLVAGTGYRFIATTPVTHERTIARSQGRIGTTLRDIFGWNLPFPNASVAAPLLDAMAKAGILEQSGRGDLLRSTVRIATIDDDLFVHSAYPTTDRSAVFFGPDTYRFARFIRHGLDRPLSPSRADAMPGPIASLRVLDVGCGSGAGGIVAARALRRSGISSAVTMNDINPEALRYTRVNAAAAGMSVELAPGDALSSVEGDFDLIVSNPPYLDDASRRAYRHGGGKLGRELGLRIATEALQRLSPGGQLLLYTGVAVVDGCDSFLSEVSPLLAKAHCQWSYEEIDPDVFGEELERPVYLHADRIAVVGLSAVRDRPRA